jgi:N-methylhydantoinase B/oxoprolinase/acetone carboxylase alpha subunit
MAAGLVRPARVTLVSAGRLVPKAGRAVPGGDFIRLELRGGGFGDPAERDPEQVALDVADGATARLRAPNWTAWAR